MPWMAHMTFMNVQIWWTLSTVPEILWSILANGEQPNCATFHFNEGNSERV